MKSFATLGLVLGLAMLLVGCAPEKKAEKKAPAAGGSAVTAPADTKAETPVEPAAPAEGDKKVDGAAPVEPAAPAEEKKAEGAAPAEPAAPAEEKKAEVPLDPAPAK